MLFFVSKASLEAMIEDCCVKFGEGRIGSGFGQNPLEQFDRDGW